MNRKSLVSVLGVLLLLMLSQQVMAGEALLNLREKLKIAGCGSEVENNTGYLFFDGKKTFYAQTSSSEVYTGRYGYSSKKRRYKMSFDKKSDKLYRWVLADWGADLCGVGSATVKNVKYKDFSLKLNKKNTRGKFKFAATGKGQANGQTASVKHTIAGKGSFNKP